VADAHAPVLGVGVGSPGIVDDRGVVLTAPNFGWQGVDLEGALRADLGLPVLVANDANAAVLAEYTFGGAADDVLLVRVGRGVGSGLLAGGQPMPAAGSPPERSVTSPSAPTAARVRVRQGRLPRGVAVGSGAGARVAEPGADRDAVLRDAGERLGIALAPIVGVLDLSEIVLSGRPDLLDGTRDRDRRDPARPDARRVPRRRAGADDGAGEDIVLRGAAVMVLSGQLGVS
jgi:predicted NBD/HSP70 family sugar kinase